MKFSQSKQDLISNQQMEWPLRGSLLPSFIIMVENTETLVIIMDGHYLFNKH